MKEVIKATFSIIICELIGLLATPFTISAIPTWYATLIKPPFSPPNWIFGPVWTLLYACMGVSAYLIYRQGAQKEKIKKALLFFLVQLVLNFFWSVIFFGMRQPLLALVDILAMLAMIIFTMTAFNKISKTAFYLFIPYLLWVSFAAILNASIVFLNK